MFLIIFPVTRLRNYLKVGVSILVVEKLNYFDGKEE